MSASEAANGGFEDATELTPEWRRAVDWVEAELGGQVKRLRRQGRWRPAYFFDLERPDGFVLPLYFRGDRGHAEGERLRGRVARRIKRPLRHRRYLPI